MKVSESEPSAAAGRHGSQACAACKYQRRKCKPECPLAPFFPSHDKERFRNVHKLFGVANVTKILQEIPPSFREIAMKCIIYDSSARAIAPVGGLGEVGLGLEQLIAVHMAELEAVRGQLEAFRAMERANGEGGCDASAQCETTSFVCGGQSSMDECEGVMEVSGHGGLSLRFNSSRFEFFV
ncbi:hypothetical protein VitviT2T_004442 [Vitis vinifera]|uniref:LOB domain-containing protein n=1 Tax=Vitis vinifera TaxID=29760 RepID=A0ABY9BQU4_VITVI|nr:LOB domain-containing protein 22-like [Vitis vinifera]WJZ84864.1 hypothetical protein VitviT2T_004442 [Vitis vinifera]|eukprot:XP_010648351.1 PREDICTED: LOB domain-containing protein 22-like [Vitis vinifera]